MGKKFKMLLIFFSLALSSAVYSDNGEIKNEEKMFGVLALVLSFMTFGAGIPSGAVALFFANLGYKRGQKFEYAVGQKSKQKTLASLAMIITIFGIIFYYITSFGDITKTLDGLPY